MIGTIISKGNLQIISDDIMTKILIVDDDKGATALIETIVVSAGYEPVVVNESSKAMEVSNRIKPDLIFLDLMMPEPTGFQLCRIMRATPGYKFTPIIIITALDDTDSRLVAFGAGANDYITKPFHVTDLLQKMKEFLE